MRNISLYRHGFRELDDLFLPLLLVKFERQADDLGLVGVGVMDSLAAVTQVRHGLTHRHSVGLRPLRPGIAVTVQADLGVPPADRHVYETARSEPCHSAWPDSETASLAAAVRSKPP